MGIREMQAYRNTENANDADGNQCCFPDCVARVICVPFLFIMISVYFFPCWPAFVGHNTGCNPLKTNRSRMDAKIFSLPNGTPISVSWPFSSFVSSMLCPPLLHLAAAPAFCFDSEQSATPFGRQPIVTHCPRLANAA